MAELGLSFGMWDLVPWPGIEPMAPAPGAQSLSHWTTREVPGTLFSRFPHGCFLLVSLISVFLSLFLESFFNLLSVAPLDNLSSRYLSLSQVVYCLSPSTRMKTLKAEILFILFTAVPLMLSTWKVIKGIVEWMNACLICAYFFLLDGGYVYFY